MRSPRSPTVAALLATTVALAFYGIAAGAGQTARRGTGVARRALLPTLPPSWGGIAALVAGALLVLALGGARIHRGAIATRSDNAPLALVTAVVIVCLFGVIAGVALPSGWTVLPGSLGGAAVAGAVALGVGFVTYAVTTGFAVLWLGTDVETLTREGFENNVEGATSLVALLALPVAAEVLSPLTGSDVPTYVGGILLGAGIVSVWGVVVWIRRKIGERTGSDSREPSWGSRRSLSELGALVRSSGGFVSSSLRGLYNRYRSSREARRAETTERIEAAREEIETVDGPTQAASVAIQDAQDRLAAGDHDRARELAAEAEDLAEWESDLIERIDAVRNRDADGPEHAPDRVEDLIQEANERLFSGDLAEAERSIEEAERLVGPEVTFLLDAARNAADDARRISGDRDREIAAWERALDRYEAARDRARELDEPALAADVEGSVRDITERLREMRRERDRDRLRDAATAAWEAVRAADDVVEDDPEAARERYESAIDHYTDALDVDEAVASAYDLRERVRAAIDCLDDAREDCRVLAARDRLSDVLSHLDDRERAGEELEEILADLDGIGSDTGALRDVARRARARVELDRVRNRIAAVESEFGGENYYDASESLEAVREGIQTVEAMIDGWDTPEARTELERLAATCREHADAIDRTLTTVDETASIEPVSEVDLAFDVSPDDVPSEDRFRGHVPASEALWESVVPDRADDRAELASLAEALRSADLRGYVDEEITDRIERRARRIEECDPVVGASDLNTEANELRLAAIDAVADLESRLRETVERLESADLPGDYYDRPATVDESVADSLRDRDSIGAFKHRWRDAVDRLTADVDAASETVTIVDTYEEVVDDLEASLAENGEVTGGEVPVRRPAEVMRIHAHRRPQVTYDPETPALRRT